MSDIQLVSMVILWPNKIHRREMFLPFIPIQSCQKHINILYINNTIKLVHFIVNPCLVVQFFSLCAIISQEPMTWWSNWWNSHDTLHIATTLWWKCIASNCLDAMETPSSSHNISPSESWDILCQSHHEWCWQWVNLFKYFSFELFLNILCQD